MKFTGSDLRKKVGTRVSTKIINSLRRGYVPFKQEQVRTDGKLQILNIYKFEDCFNYLKKEHSNLNIQRARLRNLEVLKELKDELIQQ